MNTEEQLLLGFLGLLAVVGIVVLIVLMVKKNGPSPGPATVPACNVVDGNGVCTSGITPQGKRMCVGGDQLCGIGLDAHKAVHKDENTCDSLQKYLPQMIQCNDGYQPYIDGDGKSNQGNCLFKCKKSNSENLTYGSSYGATSDGCTLYTAGGSG